MKRYLRICLLSIVLINSSLFVMSQEKKRASFNHLALYVTDLKKSTWFYQEVIGLDTIPEPFHDGRHTWFQVSEHGHLHLISGAAGPKVREKDTHLCFSVPTISDVISRLDKNKIPFESWAGESGKITRRVDGVQQIYFKDPDGFWIEINDDSPKAK